MGHTVDLMIIWKVVYNDYVIAYPNSPFYDDTLKDWLWDILKDLNTDSSNEEGTKKVILHDSNEVLA
jgi:hypothetical protein